MSQPTTLEKDEITAKVPDYASSLARRLMDERDVLAGRPPITRSGVVAAPKITRPKRFPAIQPATQTLRPLPPVTAAEAAKSDDTTERILGFTPVVDVVDPPLTPSGNVAVANQNGVALTESGVRPTTQLLPPEELPRPLAVVHGPFLAPLAEPEPAPESEPSIIEAVPVAAPRVPPVPAPPVPPGCAEPRPTFVEPVPSWFEHGEPSERRFHAAPIVVDQVVSQPDAEAEARTRLYVVRSVAWGVLAAAAMVIASVTAVAAFRPAATPTATRTPSVYMPTPTHACFPESAPRARASEVASGTKAPVQLAQAAPRRVPTFTANATRSPAPVRVAGRTSRGSIIRSAPF